MSNHPRKNVYYRQMSWAVLSRSVASDSATLLTAARQVPLSVEFSRPEYGSGYPFPPPGDLPNPVIEPGSPAVQADSLPLELPGKPNSNYSFSFKRLSQRWILIITTVSKNGGDTIVDF